MLITLSRRQRLIVRHMLISLSLVLVATAALFFLRQRPKHYSPGEKVEGITSELTRSLPAGYPAVHFTDVTRQAGIDFVHFSTASVPRSFRKTWAPERPGAITMPTAFLTSTSATLPVL